MTDVFGVRAEFGIYSKQFVQGGCVAIGKMPVTDLTVVRSRDEL